MSLILFNTLIPHGKVTNEIVGDTLMLTTQSSITSIAYNLVGNSYKRHYMEIPQKARIPFTLTVELMLDYQGLIFLIGDGHLLFNCPSMHSIADPIKPLGKSMHFCNHIPQNTFVTISMTYGLHEMQVSINGKEVFFSGNLPYMKAKPLSEQDNTALCLGFEVAKLSKLYVRRIELTEHAQSIPAAYLAPHASEEATLIPGTTDSIHNNNNFECFACSFSEDIKSEIIDTDAYLKSLKALKMKRTIDKDGDKLTYIASDFGISYILRRVNEEAWQSFSFYIVTSGKADTWHRKADYMEEVLSEISKTDCELAERIFNALNDCVGCYGSKCIVKTLYNFNDKKKLACHGTVMLRLCHADFQDIRSFFGHLAKLIERKTIEGTLQTEKITLLNKDRY